MIEIQQDLHCYVDNDDKQNHNQTSKYYNGNGLSCKITKTQQTTSILLPFTDKTSALTRQPGIASLKGKNDSQKWAKTRCATESTNCHIQTSEGRFDLKHLSSFK